MTELLKVIVIYEYLWQLFLLWAGQGGAELKILGAGAPIFPCTSLIFWQIVVLEMFFLQIVTIVLSTSPSR